MTSTASIHIPDLAETAPPAPSTSTVPSASASTSTPQTATTHILPPPFHKTQPTPELLTQGAEGLVYKTTFLDSTPAILKYRPSKPYRHPTLDARLTKQRVLAEARILVKLSGFRNQGVCVPAVLGVEWDVGRKVKGLNAEQRGARVTTAEGGSAVGAWILMEWIEGQSVKALLREWDVWFKEHGKDAEEAVLRDAEEQVKALLRRVGRAVGLMHSVGGVIHGDLTSSNIMVRPVATSQSMGQQETGSNLSPSMEGEIVLIDFGLATQGIQDEDRAVDLYVLERAFGSTHPRQEGWFDREVLQCNEGYRGAFKGAGGILKKLEEVRLRGRKRTMIG